MQLTKEQATIAYAALCFLDIKQTPRVFPLAELQAAGSIANALVTNCIDKEKRDFIEGNIEMGTVEKALLLRCLQRDWPALDSISVFSLKEILEA